MKTKQPKQKRMYLLAILAVVVCALLLWGTVHFLRTLLAPDGADAPEIQYSQAELAQYLTDQWPDYALSGVDSGANTVTVCGEALITFDQARRYGEATYDRQMLKSYVDTARAISIGVCTECGMEGTAVVLEQRSSDGRVILTAASDGTVETCWGFMGDLLNSEG